MAKTREYVVTVVQPLEKIHYVQATSLRQARAIISGMISNNVEPPELTWSTSGDVGEEKIVDVSRAPD